MRKYSEERLHFRLGEVAPASGRQVAEPDVHDADADETLHAPAERGAHAADLAIDSLRQHDAEAIRTGARHGGRLRLLGSDANAPTHHREEGVCDIGLDRHQVLLLVTALDAQDFVDDVAVVREEDESLGVLVETTDRK